MDTELEKPFNLILISSKVNNKNGIDIIKQINEDPEIINKPEFLVITSSVKEDITMLTNEVDSCHLLIKPFTRSMIYNSIINLFTTSYKITGNKKKKSNKSEQKSSTIAKAEIIIINPHPDELVFKFKYEFGIPENNIKAFSDYITKDYVIPY